MFLGLEVTELIIKANPQFLLSPALAELGASHNDSLVPSWSWAGIVVLLRSRRYANRESHMARKAQSWMRAPSLALWCEFKSPNPAGPSREAEWRVPGAGGGALGRRCSMGTKLWFGKKVATVAHRCECT